MAEIIRPGVGASNAFVVLPGKQVTLRATGLAGDEYVEVQIVELSRAPEFTGDSCCATPASDVVVLNSVPLLCAPDSPVRLTQEIPFAVINGPQLVTLQAVVVAGPGALVSVELLQTEDDCCAPTICQCLDNTWEPSGAIRCVGENVEREEVSNCGNKRWEFERAVAWTDTGGVRCEGANVEKEQVNDCGATKWVAKGPQTWTPTGQERCVGANVELEEKNDCGTVRWVVDRAASWTDTGAVRCEGTNVEKEQVNECGTTQWVIKGPQTWTPTGQERCVGANVEREEKNDCCCETRWVTDRAVAWTPTGETRCENNLIENKEANDCGAVRWTATATVCGYCPSLRVSCDGQSGFGFHEMDPKDPAATVEMAPCAGDTSVDSLWIYPSAGPGHTVKVTDCDGVLIGYAVNKSDCAPDCGCNDPVINIKTTVAAPVVNVAAPEVTNNFAPTTNVAAPKVTNNFAPTTNVAAPAVNVRAPEVTNNFAPTTNVAAPEVTTNVAAPEVTNNFAPTTNVAAPEVNITQAAPNLVAQVIADDGTITSTLSDGSTVVSNPLPSC
jgi:hypothetical protein